mgnify:FL=1
MAEYASNGLGTAENFRHRRTYMGFTSVYSDPTLIDFIYEHIFYGKMDPKGDAIFLNAEKLKSIDESFWAINFVADAFLAMRSHLEECIKRGSITPSGDGIPLAE